MLIGYARVSTSDQNPDHQIDALLRAGVEADNIHVDKASGVGGCPIPFFGERMAVLANNPLPVRERGGLHQSKKVAAEERD
jgi:hypothetical protein